MSEDTIVLGAAIIRDFRLLVARRSQPPAMAGYWELPGTELDGDERGTLDGFFTHEFCAPLNCVDQLLSDRSRTGWHRGDVLRVWRCQLPGEVVDAPRPSGYRYDDVAWVPLDDLDSVGPWRDEARIAAGEVADYYLADTVWQEAD